MWVLVSGNSAIQNVWQQPTVLSAHIKTHINLLYKALQVFICVFRCSFITFFLTFSYRLLCITFSSIKFSNAGLLQWKGKQNFRFFMNVFSISKLWYYFVLHGFRTLQILLCIINYILYYHVCCDFFFFIVPELTRMHGMCVLFEIPVELNRILLLHLSSLSDATIIYTIL